MAKSHGPCFLSQTHPHTHGCGAVNAHSLSATNKTAQLTHKQEHTSPPPAPARTGSASVPRSPLPGQGAATPAGRCLCQCGTISQAATGKRQHTDTQARSFLHLQRMVIHDHGVFQTLKTWPGSMHHSISTVSSLMRLNPSVNHSDHLSRGGETG